MQNSLLFTIALYFSPSNLVNVALISAKSCLTECRFVPSTPIDIQSKYLMSR